MKTENLDLPERIKQDYIDSGITELNPPQEKAVEAGLLNGEDMIVASPTASGKTFIAELAIVEKAVKEGKTAVYVVPLKALASEKYEDFSDRYKELNVKISVGNRDEAGEYLENADVVIVTSEKLDSMLRHNPSWIHDIGLVVIDEIHLLTSKNRGPTLEVTLTKLRDMLDFQLLGLSATISNSGELAEWLEAELVESDYRPVELRHGIYSGNEIEFHEDDEELEENEEEKTGGEDSLSGWQTGNEVKKNDTNRGEKYFVEDIHGKPVPNLLNDTFQMDKQAIVFCSSRKGAEKSSDRAAKITEEELNREEKKKLEEYADRILNALGSPTSQCERLAENVRKGAAFHHAGLCLSGDSLVLHPDGSFSQMEKLVENDVDEAIGLEDYSIDDNSIKEKHKLGEKPVLEIKTSLGRSLKASKNHQLPVLTEEGLDWRKSKNLREGDRIATPRNLNIQADTVNLRSLLRDEVRTYRKYGKVDEIAEGVDTGTLDKNFRKRYRKDRNISVGGLRKLCKASEEDPDEYLDEVMSKAGQKPVQAPKELDKDISWLIGAVAGDGWIGSSEINLSGSSKPVLNRFRDIVNEKFGRDVSVVNREKDEVKILKFSSKAVADILHDHFGIPRENKAHNLRMPDLGLPDELLASYLRGLFDTDGSVNCRENSDGASCIEFYTASSDLATEVHTSLLRFGILAHRDKRSVKGRKTEIEGHEVNTNGDIHRILLYGADRLRKYQEDIGFTHSEKSSKLKEALSKNPEGGRRQNDVIPETLGTKVRKIRNEKDLSLSDLEPELSRATVSRFENHKTPMKRDNFQQLAEKLESRKLQKIAHSDIYWDRIESIEEKREEKLYDLSTSTENFIANGLIAHNTTQQRELVEQAFKKDLIKSVSATPTLAAGVNLPAFRVIIRDLKRYDGDGMNWIPVLEYEQMTGRAGRPKYDNRGEAISVAKNPGSVDEIRERYILGEPERIQSKLNVEPVLRMHTLALVASNFCNSMDDLQKFYRKTFYAHQFGDMQQVAEKIRDVVENLRDYEFIEEDELRATKIGKKVSDLYIDPDSAHYMLESLEKAEGTETRPISYLVMLAMTSEMAPRLRVKDKEFSDYQNALQDAELYLLDEVPEEWEPGYEKFLEAMKTAMMMQSWIQEMDEERIMNEFGTAPGGIRAKMQNADWLLYGAKELIRMRGMESDEVENDIEKLRVRMEHGIKEELLDLVQYDQIGRVRARKLSDHGIETQSQIREVSFEKLKKLIGKKTAEKLKKQVGQENIFDREDITDWYD
ncbi:MAG: DEAD/DEAH box helicase [Candidatus Nanohalobium sp.]